MIRRPPRSTRTDTLFPYTTLFRSMRRTGICGATETLLIDRAYADPRPILSALVDAGCELRGTDEVRTLDSRIKPASDEDWDTEYLDSILSVALVDGVDAAMDPIAAQGPHHTNALVTEDEAPAENILDDVHSAIVGGNAPTQVPEGNQIRP